MTRFLFLLAGLLLITGCKENQSAEIGDLKSEQARVADAIAQLSPTKLVLYSLNPSLPPISEGLSVKSENAFHGFQVLKTVEIISLEDKKSLIEEFASGIRKCNGTVMRCFDPHHGLRAMTQIATNDFVICFECLQTRAFGFGPAESFPISASPQSVFDKFLSKYEFKKAN